MKPSWPYADRDKELAEQAFRFAVSSAPTARRSAERIANIALLFALARSEGATAAIKALQVEISERPLSRDVVVVPQ